MKISYNTGGVNPEGGAEGTRAPQYFGIVDPAVALLRFKFVVQNKVNEILSHATCFLAFACRPNFTHNVFWPGVRPGPR